PYNPDNLFFPDNAITSHGIGSYKFVVPVLRRTDSTRRNMRYPSITAPAGQVRDRYKNDGQGNQISAHSVLSGSATHPFFPLAKELWHHRIPNGFYPE